MKQLPAGIDINGLCRQDQLLISKFGFWAWVRAMERAAGQTITAKARAPRKRKICVVCENPFHTSRERKFCSTECRVARDTLQKRASTTY